MEGQGSERGAFRSVGELLPQHLEAESRVQRALQEALQRAERVGSELQSKLAEMKKTSGHHQASLPLNLRLPDFTTSGVEIAAKVTLGDYSDGNAF